MSTHNGSVGDARGSPAVELDVSDLERSVGWYASLGFVVAVERPERKFAYLTRDGCADVMLQALEGPGERLRTATLESPFGRGVCILIPCTDVDAVYSAFVAAGGRPLTEVHERRFDLDVLRPTARWTHRGARRVVNRQFVAADPDGYLLRLYTESSG
jgi:catechol 2,3-dioxygenase-like lactoylglutathione lyase family enzyme